jgi:microcystin-dependent protein
MEICKPQVAARSDFVKTLTPDTSPAALLLAILFPEDTTNGTDGDDWSAASLEIATQRLLNRVEKNKLDALALQARVEELETRTVFQIGSVQEFAGSIGAIPNGFLLCDGAAISRTTYSALFARIGTKFGAGDNSTTFNLPNLIGKFVKGGTEATRGDAGGSNAFVLDLTHLPAHSHNITVDATVASTVSGNTANDGAHGHYNVGSRGSGGSGYLGLQIIEVDNTDDWTGTVANSVGMFSSPPPSGAALGYTTPNYGSSHQHGFSFNLPAHSHTATAASVGAGQAFDNQPSFVTLLKIIRVL